MDTRLLAKHIELAKTSSIVKETEDKKGDLFDFFGGDEVPGKKESTKKAKNALVAMKAGSTTAEDLFDFAFHLHHRMVWLTSSDGSLKQSYEEAAIFCFEHAAEQGHLNAYRALINIYHHPYAFSMCISAEFDSYANVLQTIFERYDNQNPTKAIQWLTRFAEQTKDKNEIRRCQLNLAEILKKKGDEISLQKATALCQKLAEKEDTEDDYSLAAKKILIRLYYPNHIEKALIHLRTLVEKEQQREHGYLQRPRKLRPDNAYRGKLYQLAPNEKSSQELMAEYYQTFAAKRSVDALPAATVRPSPSSGTPSSVGQMLCLLSRASSSSISSASSSSASRTESDTTYSPSLADQAIYHSGIILASRKQSDTHISRDLNELAASPTRGFDALLQKDSHENVMRILSHLRPEVEAMVRDRFPDTLCTTIGTSTFPEKIGKLFAQFASPIYSSQNELGYLIQYINFLQEELARCHSELTRSFVNDVSDTIKKVKDNVAEYKEKKTVEDKTFHMEQMQKLLISIAKNIDAADCKGITYDKTKETACVFFVNACLTAREKLSQRVPGADYFLLSIENSMELKPIENAPRTV